MRSAFKMPTLANAVVLSALLGGSSLAAQDTANTHQAIVGGEVKCVNGKAKGFDCQNVDLISFLPPDTIGCTSNVPLYPEDNINVMLNSMWGWTDSATHRDFAVVGCTDGTVFVEITDPANPRYLGKLPRHMPSEETLWRDIKVYKNHAFIVADRAGPDVGMQVFDLTQLRAERTSPAVFQETAFYENLGSAHTPPSTRKPVMPMPSVAKAAGKPAAANCT